MGDAVGLACQPLGRRLFPAVDPGRGKLLHKGQDGLIQFLLADAPVEPPQRVGHDLGIEALAVVVHQGVAHLVDQTHGVERSRVDRLGWVFFRIPQLVHAESELAAGA